MKDQKHSERGIFWSFDIHGTTPEVFFVTLNHRSLLGLIGRYQFRHLT